MSERIAFISNHYLPIIGGIEQNIHKVSQHLSIKYDVEILVAENTSGKLVKNDGEASVCFVNSISYLKKDYSKFRAVVVTNFSILPQMLVMVNFFFKRYKNTKLILVPHGGATLDWTQFKFKDRLIKKIYNRLLGLSLLNRTVDSVIAVSNWEQKELIDIGVKREIHVIRNGIDRLDIKNVCKEDYVIYLGRIAPIKNIESAIDVFNRLCQIPAFSHYKLLIVGNVEQYPEYYTKLKNHIFLNKIKNIQFVGEKLGNDKLRILSKARAALCLSHWENDPIVIKEAFSVGTNVIINTKYGLGDFALEPNTLVYDAKTGDTELEKFILKEFQDLFINKIDTWIGVAKEYEKIFL